MKFNKVNASHIHVTEWLHEMDGWVSKSNARTFEVCHVL